MIAFRVISNGGTPVTSGVSDGVSSVSVTTRRPFDPAEGDLFVWYDVGALDGASDELLDWRRDVAMQPGDRLVVEVIELPDSDPPQVRRGSKEPPEGWAEEAEAQDEPGDAGATVSVRERLAQGISREGGFPLTRPENPFTALQIEINGGPPLTAGLEYGVVTAMVTFQSPPLDEKTDRLWTCGFSLAGLDIRLGRYLYWDRRDLVPGDVLVITVVTTTEVDAEISETFFVSGLNEVTAP